MNFERPTKPPAMSRPAQTCFDQIRHLMQQHADPEKGRPMERYMKNKFEFFGIQTPDRKRLSQQHFQIVGIPEGETLKEVCRLCFQAEQRELQYFVNDLMQKASRRIDASFLDLYEELISVRSWWDTVDFLSPKLAGTLFLRFPQYIKPYTERWISSDNFWYQRAAIIFQLGYKDKTDADLLFGYIRRRAGSKEFFVQKGAGWALREYSKTDPDAVAAFIDSTELPALTVREGSKRLPSR